jgi:hypothetical protein
MSMRILKSIFICIFLCSSGFFAASDVLDRRPQDIRKGAPGGGIFGPQSSLFEDASGTGSRTIFGTSEKERGSTADLLQFTAGGHVLGFRKGEMFIAAGDHALSVEFVNARRASPEEKIATSNPEKSPRAARPLGKVAYNDLWDGVTLVYENHGAGVVKSSYHVEAGGIKAVDRVDQIRLRYNVPVKVDEAGDLILSFKTGEMRESRPVAWQELGGNRVPVEVTYRLRGGQEVGFKAGSYDSRYPLVIDPVLSWNTFLGGSNTDYSYGIAVDTSGNVYVTGWSNATWGSPVRPFTGGETDVFVARLNNSGVLQWNTFLGGSDIDTGYGIDVDTSGNVYVAGRSDATWGLPIRPFAGGAYDGFVAKLNASGVLQWNTFLGGVDIDEVYRIAVDTSGNIYVTGYSGTTWGSPVLPFAGGNTDGFVARLNNSGALQWNTFLGGSNTDYVNSIALDTSGNAYVIGWSTGTWGSPILPFAGLLDPFIAKLNGNGALRWNTFLGGPIDLISLGLNISVDTSGNVYVTGYSVETWGSPVRPFAGENHCLDAFVAKLDDSGALQWNTFLGSSEDDYGYGIAVDTIGNVYVTGKSYATWGSPVRPFAGGPYDAFVARLNNSGVLQWNSFLGGLGSDVGSGIAVDTSGIVYVTGTSGATWGSPVSPFGGGPADAFVAKFTEILVVSPPSNLTAVRLTNRSLSQNEYIVDLRWDPNPANAGLTIVGYRVYQKMGDAWVTLADLSPNNLTYRVRRVPNAQQTFGVASINEGGVESVKITVVK